MLLLVFAADFGQSWIRQRGQAKPEMQFDVRSEKGAAGHNTIGIDEESLRSGGGSRFLHFATLGGWEYSIDSRPPCPKPIRALSGRRFDCIGFMYPLQTGEKIKDFCLLRSTQTCCYGPRSQFNQYILVEMREPVEFQRLAPVMVSGKFFVEPRPDDGYIYRMEGESVANVGEDTPDVEPVGAARKAGLPLFDFAALEAMAGREKSEGVAESLRKLSGKKVVAAGYCVARTAQPMKIVLAKNWWDGVAQGTPPTVFNAIPVFPVDEAQAPPLWKPYQVFTGTLEVTADPGRWARDGVIQLRDAELGVPGVTRPVRRPNRQFIPIGVKAGLLAGLLLATLRYGSKGPAAIQR